MARRIFPSYDWDDAWYVNQIIKQSKVRQDGWIQSVPNEEVQSSDKAIADWIKQEMKSCSCVIVFIGEQTHRSEWVKYEINLAAKLKKAQFMVDLEGMRFKEAAPVVP